MDKQETNFGTLLRNNTHLSPVTGSTLRRVNLSRMVSVGTSIKITLKYQKGRSEK